MSGGCEFARARSAARRRQRGNAIVVALIALTGLAMLGAVTVSSVQTGLTSANAERSAAIARYAAESGILAGMDYLRTTVYRPHPTNFSYVTRRANATIEDLPGMPGNREQPGATDNPFSADMKAWYDVRILNNVTDPKFDDAAAESLDQEDSDRQIVLRSVGYGPDGATITLEAELKLIDPAAPTNPTPPDPNTFVILTWRDLPDSLYSP